MMNGMQLRDAIISGANHIINQKKMVDELNVFPVPDGDTGTNMSMTITAGAKALAALREPTVTETADAAASAFLRGARGNSGVILSLLFRGISQGLKGKTEADGADLAAALGEGVKSAYKAVMNPTEGTILTVARVAAEKAKETALSTNDPSVVMRTILDAARETLAQTPEMLPVLKKAGVVDAGGMGLVVIFEGMHAVLCEGRMIASQEKPEKDSVAPAERSHRAVADADEDIRFGYCTEYIVNRSPEKKDPLALRAYLESIGDCVVVVDDDEIIKVHVHTNAPGNAIQEGLKYGYLTNMKIDNMRFQHENKVHEANQMEKEQDYAAVDPEIPFGFVAVGAGAGIHSLFGDLGVNRVVSGGQTMNPSTDDILRAIQSVPAQNVFVLPNNKNIIMAAEQAVALADRNVCVLQTRTIPQGIAAMLAFDPEASFADNRLSMTKAFDRVSTGQVTFAARDSDFDGHKIKQGEILAIENGKLTFVERDVAKATYKLTRGMLKRGSEYVTLIYGADVTDEQAEALYQVMTEKFGDDVEITLVNGGQPVYYYIISVE
ncbi:MAG TPA: DAK2 domain-containing protein [Firmicutes bacterium]|nr:DAK2 domain-containing protein [Bacillota bacterium]